MAIKIQKIIVLLILSLPLMGGTITQTFAFSEADFNFEKVDGYDVITMSGVANLAEAGNPLLPQKSFIFIIPPRAEVVDVKALNKSTSD